MENEEKKEELVVKTSGIIEPTFNYPRIEFDKPVTIMQYGQDTVNGIIEVLETTVQLNDDTQEVIINEEQLKKISSFDVELDDSDKKANKKELAVVKGVKGLLTKLGVKKFEKDKQDNSYRGKFEEYCALIEEVSNAVYSQQQGSLADINLRDEIVKSLQPHLDELQELIVVGYQDLEKYKAEIEEMKKQPSTFELQKEIEYRNQLAEVTSNKLDKLEKARVLYVEQIQAYRIQQRTDMEIVMASQTYLDHTAPILKAQGSVMVFNRRQEKKLANAVSLNESANEAIRNNALAIEENAKTAVELSINNGISVETLAVYNDSLRKGIEIYRSGREKRRQRIESDKKQLTELNQALESYQQEVLQLIDDEAVIEYMAKTSSGEKDSSRKALTYNNRNKRKK